MDVTIVVPVKDEAAEPLVSMTKTRRMRGHTLTWLVVDDGSRTPHPASVSRHLVSRGYGATLKRGLAHATTDWVATMDGDGQHEVEDVVRLIELVQRFPGLDMVIGDRRVRETECARFLGRKALNWTASLFAGRWIADLNSGLRLFRRRIALGYCPILCDGFSFTTTLTLSMLADGYAVDWLPIKVLPRVSGTSKVCKWRDGWATLKAIVWVGSALRTRRVRALWRRVRDSSRALVLSIVSSRRLVEVSR